MPEISLYTTLDLKLSHTVCFSQIYLYLSQFNPNREFIAVTKKKAIFDKINLNVFIVMDIARPMLYFMLATGLKAAQSVGI